MTTLIRAELLKLRTSRGTLGLATALLALVCFVVLLHGFALPKDFAVHGRVADGQMKVFGWGELGALFAGLLGALSITGELRHGTIRPTFLATPRRSRVIGAKVVAVGLAGLLFGLAAELLAIGLGAAALGLRGIPIRLDGSDYAQLLTGGVIAGALWAPLSLGLGALVRNQVATVVGLCAWLLFIESLLIGQVPGFARYLPGAAAAAIGGATLMGDVPTHPSLLVPVAGALLLAVWAALAVLIGIVSTVRRDVP
ncbi:MAG: ABC transporter permease [Actinobacteria bacterium]|nr:ABC transporter permease [Actinomycetota bacterium]